MVQTSADLYQQLINWHKIKHTSECENIPSALSAQYLNQLATVVLLPISKQFSKLTITYGFTSPELSRYIQRYSPSGTAPNLDQHACVEVNTKDKLICDRNGAACDFLVKGYENRMHEVAQYICQHLPFDKLYFYGRNRPIHISVSNEPLGHLQRKRPF